MSSLRLFMLICALLLKLPVNTAPEAASAYHGDWTPTATLPERQTRLQRATGVLQAGRWYSI